MKNTLYNLYKKYLTINDYVPNKMKAILQNGFGDSGTLYIGETDIPVFNI